MLFSVYYTTFFTTKSALRSGLQHGFFGAWQYVRTLFTIVLKYIVFFVILQITDKRVLAELKKYQITSKLNIGMFFSQNNPLNKAELSVRSQVT